MQLTKLDDLSQFTEEYLEEKQLNQALLYFLDHIAVQQQSPLAPNQLSAAQLIEGYWFGGERCLHLFKDGDQKIHAVLCSDQEEEKCIDRSYLIQNRQLGSQLHIRYYFSPDADGCNHINFSRPLQIIK